MTQRYKPIKDIDLIISGLKSEESILDLEIICDATSSSFLKKDDNEDSISSISDAELSDKYEKYNKHCQLYSSKMKDKGIKLVQYLEKIKAEMNWRKMIQKENHGIGASTCQQHQPISDDNVMDNTELGMNKVSRVHSVLEEAGFGNDEAAFSLELEVMKKSHYSTEIKPVLDERNQKPLGMQSKDHETMQRSKKNIGMSGSDAKVGIEQSADDQKQACIEGGQVLGVTPASSKYGIDPLCTHSPSQTRSKEMGPLESLGGKLLDLPAGDCSSGMRRAGKRTHKFIGDSLDTAMELSDDECKHLKDFSCTTIHTRATNHARCQGLRSTLRRKEGVTFAYPSRSDPEAIEIRYSDMQHLAPSEFLNDTIIDFYIKYIQRPDYLNNERRNIFHFFNSFFYKKLVLGKRRGSDPFLKVRKWTKGINIFEKTYLFIPIHDSAHWSLAIVCFERIGIVHPCILHLDSMSSGHVSQHIFRVLKAYLEAEWKHALNNYSGAETQRLSATYILERVEVPLQENEWDCGLFLLYYIERFVQDAPLQFQYRDLKRMFGRNWFKPQQASALRNTIWCLLERLLQIEEMEDPISTRRQIVQEIFMEDLD